MSFSFEKACSSQISPIGPLLLGFIGHPPHIIYIDLSLDTDNVLLLARLLKRENSLRSLPMVAVTNYLSSTVVISQGLSVGISLIHIKSGDFSGIVLQPMGMIFPRESFPVLPLPKWRRNLF